MHDTYSHIIMHVLSENIRCLLHVSEHVQEIKIKEKAYTVIYNPVCITAFNNQPALIVG